MEGIRKKKKIWVIAIYILHFIVYFLISNLMINDMLEFEKALQKFDVNYTLIPYNHIYISIFYFILSTYYTLSNLNFKFSKKINFVIYISAFIFFFIALYKYYTLNDFIKMSVIFNGLLVSLNLICRKITS